MSESYQDIKRCIAPRKTAAIMDINKGETTVAAVEHWMDDFVSQGAEALRSNPCDTHR